MSNFYMVESSVSAAVWQVDPQGMVRQLQLKRQIGCFATSTAPMVTCAEAVANLHELFPSARQVKADQQVGGKLQLTVMITVHWALLQKPKKFSQDLLTSV